MISVLFGLRTPPLRSLSSFVILFLLAFSLATLQACCYSIVGRFSFTGLDWCAFSRSWPWIPWYFEVLRSGVFRPISTNFRWPLRQATHSIGSTTLPPSIHCQLFHRPALRRWSVQPTRQIWTLCMLIHTAICYQDRLPARFLYFRRLVISSCFIFFFICTFLC